MRQGNHYQPTPHQYQNAAPDELQQGYEDLPLDFLGGADYYQDSMQLNHSLSKQLSLGSSFPNSSGQQDVRRFGWGSPAEVPEEYSGGRMRRHARSISDFGVPDSSVRRNQQGRGYAQQQGQYGPPSQQQQRGGRFSGNNSYAGRGPVQVLVSQAQANPNRLLQIHAQFSVFDVLPGLFTLLRVGVRHTRFQDVINSREKHACECIRVRPS